MTLNPKLLQTPWQFVLISPNNPTGVVFNEKALKELVDIRKSK